MSDRHRPPRVLEAASPNSGQGCAVCEHELAAHDAVGHRYCRATLALALPRTCICRPPS